MVSVLNDAARTLEDLRAELPSVVDEAAAPLRKRRDATRDAQNSLWGQAKAPTRGRDLVDERSAGRPVGNRPRPDRAPVFGPILLPGLRVAANHLPTGPDLAAMHPVSESAGSRIPGALGGLTEAPIVCYYSSQGKTTGS